MKKIYETACDERRESAVAVEIGKKWQCDSIKFGQYQPPTFQKRQSDGSLRNQMS